MTIEFKEFRIGALPENVVLFKKYIGESGKRKGQNVEKVIGYYNNLQTAMLAMTREHLNTSEEINSIKDVLKEIKLMREEIKFIVSTNEKLGCCTLSKDELKLI